MPYLNHPLATRSLLRFLAIAAAGLATQGCFASFGAAKPEIAVKDSVTTPDKAMKTGWEYMDQRAYGAALQAFRAALSGDPTDENLQFGLAEAYRYAGHHELAEKRYAELLQSEQYRNAALTGIGHVKLASYDASGAFEMFSTAVAEDETAWKAWLGLAQLRDLAKDWDAADEAYQRALANTPDSALVLNNHGVSMIARGDPQTALTYLEMAASIAADSPRIQTNIDLARAMLGGGEHSVKDSHLDSKTLARKLNNRGYVAMLSGDFASAEQYFLEAIEAHPSFYAVAHKNLHTLKTAKAAKQQR